MRQHAYLDVDLRRLLGDEGVQVVAGDFAEALRDGLGKIPLWRENVLARLEVGADRAFEPLVPLIYLVKPGSRLVLNRGEYGYLIQYNR